MPLKKLVIPSFKGKGEEAVWWEDHRADVEADLRAAMRGGQTISLSEVLSRARRKKDLRPVTIRLASEDIATARQLADDEGIGYQTYIKILLHQALQKEAGRRRRSGK
jgi:predicted DNA binding CopG/RHH family protein